ncbi:MAG: hypothetical protein ABIC95_07040 [archaeon]
MLSPDVITESPVSLTEAKQHLDAMKKRDEELNFRANKTLDYLQQFPLLSPAKTKEFRKKIEALDVPRLKEIHILKIADMMPNSVEDLKVVLQGYTLTVNQDNMKKIVGVIKEYALEKK